MNDVDDGAKNTEGSGFSKVAALFGTTSDRVEDSASNQKSTTLKHAPVLPSSEDIARMTAPKEKKGGVFTGAGIIFERPSDTPIRDPLFAARILQQEKSAGTPQKIAEEKNALSDFEAPRADKDADASPRVRTYQSDVAGALKKEKTSLIQMVLAEQGKKRDSAEEASPRQPKNLALIIISMILIMLGVSLAGIIAWKYAVKKSEEGAKERANLSVPAIIFSENQRSVDMTDLSKERIARRVSAEIASVNVRLDFIEQFYFVKDAEVSSDSSLSSSGEKIKTLVGAPQFFAALESGMPDSLARALSLDFFFGVHVFNGNQPFIILRTDYFENAFAGMLKWEKTMARDIFPIFGKQVTPDIVTRPFEDVVIRNRDFRALRDEGGNILLLYLFHDKNTAVIATAEETINEVVDRLNKPR